MKKSNILIVDDEPGNLDTLRSILHSYYQVSVAIDGKSTLDLVAKTPPDLILLDIMMPEMDGYEVCRRLKSNSQTAQIPVIFITTMGSSEEEFMGLELGAVDYITKPVNSMIVQARVRTHLMIYQQHQICEEKVGERTKELRAARHEVVERLKIAASWRDNDIGLHVKRMAAYSVALARKFGWDQELCDLLLHAAPMHDIGKIGIPDGILLSTDQLTSKEWAVMKDHSRIGAEILGEGASSLMRMSREIAISHHEKWNGLGYPAGLKEEAIPMSGRIVAIADVFDALTMKRPYKKAWSTNKAFALITEEAGKHFDPKLALLFLEIRDEILKIREQFSDKE